MNPIVQDTIYALSTPPGKSGVAVIRASGPSVPEAFRALGIPSLPPARLATLAALRTLDGLDIDRALVLYFPAPHSFTGEDIAEFQVHGGRSVIRCVLAQLGTLPSFRLAEPGEFMRRAFLNGKMDLTAAEGLADLIDAETESQRRQALRLMQGEAAQFYNRLRGSMLHTLAYLEAYIDFPEEEIPEQVLEEISGELTSLASAIRYQLAHARIGQTIREGVRIAIIGPPNAGKSSLLNLLAQREAAIVSEHAGTTRDVIEVHLELAGYSVTLVDTAGIREQSGDAIEQEGIRRSLREADEADIRILLLDASTPSSRPTFEKAEDERTVIVYNKSELAQGALPSPSLSISVLRKEGIETLLDAIEQKLENFSASEALYVTRARHEKHLLSVLDYINNYLSSSSLPLELQCEELRRAATEIGKITGAIAVDELLGHIFSAFCIGK